MIEVDDRGPRVLPTADPGGPVDGRACDTELPVRYLPPTEPIAGRRG